MCEIRKNDVKEGRLCSHRKALLYSRAHATISSQVTATPYIQVLKKVIENKTFFYTSQKYSLNRAIVEERNNVDRF